MNLYDVVRYPLITEKSAIAAEINKYVFRVHPDATKTRIRESIELAYGVKVTAVRTMNVSGKLRRIRFKPGMSAAWKKAIVTLKQGDKIDLTQ